MGVIGNDIVVFGREVMSLHQLLKGDLSQSGRYEEQIPVPWDVIIVIGLPGVMMLREADLGLPL